MPASRQWHDGAETRSSNAEEACKLPTWSEWERRAGPPVRVGETREANDAEAEAVERKVLNGCVRRADEPAAKCYLEE